MPDYETLAALVTTLLHIGVAWMTLSLVAAMVWMVVRAPGRAQRLAVEEARAVSESETPNGFPHRAELRPAA